MDVVVGDDGVARCSWGASTPDYHTYHDTEWGFGATSEQRLFEKLCLEGFQSGLSWITILRKRENFRAAFRGFDPEVVASFDDTDRERLLADAGIVRNRAKIDATIRNAAATVALRDHPDGDLARLIWSFRPEQTPAPRRMAEIPTQSPESVALSKTLKRHGFTFVGPTTMFALMEAVGIVDTHLIGSHRRGTSGVW